MAMDVSIIIKVEREYTWSGPVEEIPADIVGSLDMGAYETPGKALDALFEAFDAPVDPAALVAWINGTMDLNGEMIEIEEVAEN